MKVGDGLNDRMIDYPELKEFTAGFSCFSSIASLVIEGSFIHHHHHHDMTFGNRIDLHSLKVFVCEKKAFLKMKSLTISSK